jgi:hypothetical protein
MELGPYVESLRRELGTAAAAGGDDARALAERLTAPLESGVRLALLDALSAAAAEITRELAPGSVDVLLRNREPVFVVTPPPAEVPIVESRQSIVESRQSPVDAPPAPPESDDGATARINFRLPDSLKSRIEDAASGVGLSVNAWLVRAAAAALDPSAGADRADRRPAVGQQRYSGWVR